MSEKNQLGVSDSEFNMWRAIFAMAHADEIVTEEERKRAEPALRVRQRKAPVDIPKDQAPLEPGIVASVGGLIPSENRGLIADGIEQSGARETAHLEDVTGRPGSEGPASAHSRRDHRRPETKIGCCLRDHFSEIEVAAEGLQFARTRHSKPEAILRGDGHRVLTSGIEPPSKCQKAGIETSVRNVLTPTAQSEAEVLRALNQSLQRVVDGDAPLGEASGS